MITPLLSTKFHLPPSRPSLIPRQRLMDRLDEGSSRKVMLISAPAGYGKTTLTSQWIKERGLPTAWISLEPDDNIIARFLLYLVTALQSVAPDHIQTSPAMLQTAQRLPVESVLSVLINELATIPGDVYFCADDYHLIESQEIHSAVGYLIEHMPEGTHLVLICRSDPPLPLSRLRARGQLIELRQADLRFSLDEATDFFNQNTGLNLTAEQVVALETRTEGWIAGLQLAAISMQGRKALDEFIEVFSGSHRYIIDYLADEIFAQQRDDMRHFLIDTSILNRFTASLCNVVTGRNDSDALLRELEENNLFIIPLDDQREWYRYHHLFHEFLLNRLDKQRQAKLHKKASEWFLSNELPSQAVKHALETGDQATAEDVITQVVADLFNQGAFQTLLDALDALPEQTVRNHVSLATFKGLTLFLLRSYEEALPYAKAAEQCLPADAPTSLQGQFLSLQAHMALCENQLDQCIRYSQDALESLDERNHFLRNLTLNVLGQVLEMKGDVVSAVVIYRQAFDSGWQDGDSLGAMVAGTNLVLALYELGLRQEAEAWCRQVLDERESHILPGIGVVDAVYLSWSILTYEANELDLALQYAQKAQELMSKVNFSQGITWGNYILARIRLAKGEYASAREYIREGRLIANQIGQEYVHGVWFDALEAQIELGGGNLQFVERWVEKMGFTPHDSPHHWYEQPYFTYTRYLLAKGNQSDAQTLLENMQTRARGESRLGKLITILVLQALCLEAEGERSGAVQKVEGALAIAAPQEYRRTFLNEGTNLLPLLVKARHVAPAFVDELCLAFQSPGIVTGDVDELIEPLTEREREILRLVARGLSNGEIAKTLFITLGTVKKHLNNIFRKLEVKSRIQAVTRGKEFGLLE